MYADDTVVYTHAKCNSSSVAAAQLTTGYFHTVAIFFSSGWEDWKLG